MSRRIHRLLWRHGTQRTQIPHKLRITRIAEDRLYVSTSYVHSSFWKREAAGAAVPGAFRGPVDTRAPSVRAGLDPCWPMEARIPPPRGGTACFSAVMKPLFRRKPKIPPVEPPPAAPSHSSELDPYVSAKGAAGRPRDPYGSASAETPQPSDAELLAEYGSGSAPPVSRLPPPTSVYRDPYTTQGAGSEFDPDEEAIQDIKYQLRSTKQESLSSSRNAVRLAREAEETATNTMVRLGEQSDTIGDTERSLDVAKAHASRAEDNARLIAQLNQSIFRPKFTRNKKAKRDAEEYRAVQRHIDERQERELTRAEMLSSQRRVEESVSNTGMFSKMRSKFGGGPAGELVDPREQRRRYQFEATASDDEMEDEIDGNLDEIAALSARMNVLGRAMGQEVDEQNRRLHRVSDKTTALDTRIYAGTKRLENLK